MNWRELMRLLAQVRIDPARVEAFRAAMIPREALVEPVVVVYDTPVFVADDGPRRCKHGSAACVRCGISARDHAHRTAGGVGEVGRLRARRGAR